MSNILLKTKFLQCDLDNTAEVLRVFERLGEEHHITYLVHNAGIRNAAFLEGSCVDQFAQTFGSNLFGLNAMMVSIIPRMKSRQFGRIVVISSVLGLVGKEARSAYSAAKHAQLGYVKCLALELATTGVTLNVVAPGLCSTGFVRQNAEFDAESFLAGRQPIKKLIPPRAIAEMVNFLTVNGASEFCTGGVYPVDGGYLAQ